MNATLFLWINQTLRCALLDTVMPVFSDKTYLVLPGVVAVLVAFYFGRRSARVCLIALVIALLLTDRSVEKGIKNVFQSPRPYASLPGLHVHRGSEWVDYKVTPYVADSNVSHSFPSSHAANIAAIAACLAFISRRTLYATVPLALMVGLSRIYTGNHYPGDVLAGYAWGVLCAWLTVRVCRAVAARLFQNRPEKVRPPISRERRAFYLVLGLWTFINFTFVLINRYSLAGDEAQYWDWSRHLALGYYSKPPMIAYWMALLTRLGGHHEWALRSGAVLLTSGALTLIYALAYRITKREHTALMAACLAIAMPSSWVGSVLMTIDPLLIFFWTLALYTFHRAVAGDRGMWAWTGLALGLGALSKYTALLLMAAFAAYLILVDRRPLRTRGPYLALLIALTCLTGVLYWNASNGWVSVRHTASIGAGEQTTLKGTLRHVGDFWGGQLAVASPILFGFMGWSSVVLARRFRTQKDAAFLFLTSAVLFGFYAVVAFGRAPEPNWPACAYIPAVIGLAWVWSERTRSRTLNRWLVAGVAVGCALGIVPRAADLIYFAATPVASNAEQLPKVHALGISFAPGRDPSNRLMGGRELGEALAKYVSDDAPNAPFLFSTHYQTTASMAFYTKDRPHAYCLLLDRRYNQYDLWGGWEGLIGRDGLFVTDSGPLKARGYIERFVRMGLFEGGEFLEQVKVYRHNALVKTYTITRMRRYSGVQPAPQTERF